MKWWMVTIVAAVILLLLADFLAFHDLFESHTVRDWLMLLATGLIVVGFVGVIARDRRASVG
jgi:protein-S-isoprenylcysteine O-methyltransferase Ste14